MASSISFGGLASGMDTSSIVDKLVELQSRPIAALQKRQSGVKSQISILADLTSKLSALETAAKALGRDGVLGFKATSTNSAFAATPGSGAAAGTYRVEVGQLARAAKARSAELAATDTIAAGTLSLTVQGKPYTVTVGDPATGAAASLEDVASALRASGAPISVSILSDGDQRWLSVASVATGYPISGTPDGALQLSHAVTGATGKALGMAIVEQARNAQLTVDGLPFTRTTNLVSDVVPGTTLALKQEGGAAEDLVLDTDLDATKAKLQSFADAYNGVLKLVQRELAVTADTDRSKTLAGDASLRGLQGRLQALVSSKALGAGTVRTLADLGLKTQSKDGTLQVDSTVLSGALARDPAAANAVFSAASTGIQSLASSLVQGYVRAGDGVLSARKEGLDRSVTRLDADIARMQARLDGYRENLVKRFTAMEEAVSKMKASGSFLSQQFSQKTST